MARDINDHVERPQPFVLASGSAEDLIEAYHRTFELLLDDAPGVAEAAFRLRHQVYCQEFGWEDPAANPDGRETDAYDARARHAVLIHRATGAAAGALRVVFPDPDNLLDGLPLQRAVNAPELHDPARFPVAKTVEISRFTLSPTFRRRSEDSVYPGVIVRPPVSGAPEGGVRIIPHMSLGLMAGVLRLCEDHDVTHMCAAMARPLHRLLEALGMSFPAIGPSIDFHGPRIPCYVSGEGMVASLAQNNPSLLSFIQRTGAAATTLRRAA